MLVMVVHDSGIRRLFFSNTIQISNCFSQFFAFHTFQQQLSYLFTPPLLLFLCQTIRIGDQGRRRIVVVVVRGGGGGRSGGSGRSVSELVLVFILVMNRSEPIIRELRFMIRFFLLRFDFPDTFLLEWKLAPAVAYLIFVCVRS